MSRHLEMPRTGQVVLKAGREKPVRRKHPWVFSGAIQRTHGDVDEGGIADVVSAEGEFLARGYVNRTSQIVVRLLTWNRDEAIDDAFWQLRLERAIQARAGEASACRLVNAESDGLPGLVGGRERAGAGRDAPAASAWTANPPVYENRLSTSAPAQYAATLRRLSR